MESGEGKGKKKRGRAKGKRAEAKGRGRRAKCEGKGQNKGRTDMGTEGHEGLMGGGST